VHGQADAQHRRPGNHRRGSDNRRDFCVAATRSVRPMRQTLQRASTRASRLSPTYLRNAARSRGVEASPRFRITGQTLAPLSGGALNVGRGSARGGLAVVGGVVRAVWQENEQRKDGRFDTQVFVARIDARRLKVNEPTRLWKGRFLGPSDVDVVAGGGRVWALPRSRTSGAGTAAGALKVQRKQPSTPRVSRGECLSQVPGWCHLTR
jgi:hypothetical protein